MMNAQAPSYEIAHRPLAIIRDWHQFRAAARARCEELRVTRATVDEVGGLAAGHTATLIAPVAAKKQSFGPMSFPALLGALGLVVVLAEDVEAIARIRHRLVPRNECQVRMQTAEMLTKARAKKHAKKRAKGRRGDSNWGRIMAARRLLIQSRRKRKQIAQTAARARWRNHKKKARPSTVHVTDFPDFGE